MNIKNKFSSLCCYNFVFYTVSLAIIILAFIVVFYTLIFKFEFAPIGFQFGFLLLSSEKVFKIHWNHFFADRHPELFTILPEKYQKDQESEISAYIICIIICTLYLLVQEKWFTLIGFLVLSAINLVVEIYTINADNAIITEKDLHYLEKHYGF